MFEYNEECGQCAMHKVLDHEEMETRYHAQLERERRETIVFVAWFIVSVSLVLVYAATGWGELLLLAVVAGGIVCSAVNAWVGDS